MYEKILLTLDGSKLARMAVPHAGELARDVDCEVVVLQVINALPTIRLAMIPAATESGQDLDELAEGDHFVQKQDALAEVERAVEQLRAAGVREARGVVRDGLPGNVILDVATAERVGAIVMATRGHSGLGREVTGSVAEYVLRHAGPAAILLVGPRSSGSPDSGGTA